MERYTSGKFSKRRMRNLLVLVLVIIFLTLGTGLSEALAIYNFSAQERKIYVLCVAEAGESWVNKNDMRDAAITFLSALGLKGEVIETADEWDALVREAPEGVIVINCHGEVVPIPTSYGTDYQSFYRDLASLIKDKGWIFIQIPGFGFFFVGNSKTVGSKYKVADSGVGVFLSALGLSYHQEGVPDLVNPWCNQEAIITDLAKNVSRAVGLRLPEMVKASRALAIATDQLPEHVKVLWYWYKVPEDKKIWQGYPYLAIVGVKVGKGMLVWGGLGGLSGSDYGTMAAVITAYILNPDLTTRAGGLPLLRKRQLFIYSLVAVGAIFVAYLIVLLYRRSAPPIESA